MALNNNKIEILEILSNKKEYLSLMEISNLFSKKIHPKTLLRELNELIKYHRVVKNGRTNSARYGIDEILRYYKKYEFLYVHKGNVNAGYLIRLEGGLRFYYANEFLLNFSEGISTILLDIKSYDFKQIPAVFEENIPEGINREILELNTKEADEFELLLKLEGNIGDLHFSKSPQKTHSLANESVSYLNVLPEILGENKFIEILEDFSLEFSNLWLHPENYDLSRQKIKKSDGISGFQYKKLVNIDFENKTINSDLDQFILKPYSKLKADPLNAYYFPHLSLNEHLFMSFAKNELHFRVPYSAVVKAKEDKEFHYVVKRFDRYKTKKFAKNTFAPFLGLTSDTKYNTSSEQMFARISKELINPKEKMELLRHYVYSIIISHEDMHSKNLSLIFEKGKVLFAPLYDICCTGIYDTSKKYDSHIFINGKQTNIRPNDFKPLCKILQIDFKEFKKQGHFIAKTYKEKLPIYINEIKKLGSIPFHKSKFKKIVGEQGDWVREKQSVEFCDILEDFHKKQVKKLEKLGWIME